MHFITKENARYYCYAHNTPCLPHKILSFVLNFSWDDYNAQWKFERVVNAINAGSQTRCIMGNVKVANVMTKHQQELHDLQYNFFSHTTGSHVKPAMQPELCYINTTNH